MAAAASTSSLRVLARTSLHSQEQAAWRNYVDYVRSHLTRASDVFHGDHESRGTVQGLA